MQALPITITLKHPFVHNKETVDEITLKKCTAWTCRHLRVGDGIPENGDEMVLVVAQSAGIDESVLDEMDPQDFRSCARAIIPLLRDNSNSNLFGKEVNLPYTYKLKDPYKLGSQEYKEIVFKQRLIMRYVRKVRPELYFEDMLNLIGCMAGLTSTEVGEMSVRDFHECVGVVFPFWLGGQGERTSEDSSQKYTDGPHQKSTDSTSKK
jgi:hypothetical protein